jgi:flagellar hook-length control protein FliK
MLATPLPAPAERNDTTARGATPEAAAPRREESRFADLLRQRRADAAQATRRSDASQDGDAAVGRTTNAPTVAADTATASRAKPAAARDAKEDEATRADPSRPAAAQESVAAAPVPLDTDEAGPQDVAAPAVTGDSGLPVALPAPVDVQAHGGASPPSASGSRPTRAATKAGVSAADDADAGRSPATAQDSTPTAASASLPNPAEPVRAAPRSRGADASLPAGAALAPTRAEIAPPAVTSVAVPVPVASPEFAELLGAQVSLFARDGLQQAELRLNPAEMGPIGVQIEIAGNEARINFSAEQAPTRDAIERALPELAAALRGEGLTLAGGGVFDRPAGSRDGTPARAEASTRRAVSAPVVALPATALRGLALPGTVDLYA